VNSKLRSVLITEHSVVCREISWAGVSRM